MVYISNQWLTFITKIPWLYRDPNLFQLLLKVGKGIQGILHLDPSTIYIHMYAL